MHEVTLHGLPIWQSSCLSTLSKFSNTSTWWNKAGSTLDIIWEEQNCVISYNLMNQTLSSSIPFLHRSNSSWSSSLVWLRVGSHSSWLTLSTSTRIHSRSIITEQHLSSIALMVSAMKCLGPILSSTAACVERRQYSWLPGSHYAYTLASVISL